MYSDQDFKFIDKCDICGCKKNRLFYISDAWGSDAAASNTFKKKVSVVQCQNCGFVYAKEILSESGKKKFWESYSTNVHQAVQEDVDKRKKMYELEYNFINNFLLKKENNDILDIGCADGSFLDFFAKNNNCYGVEIGKDALFKARQKYFVYEGELPNIKIDKKFDLIILRGVIQYIDNPKQYFDKVIELLSSDGLLYITSTPNVDSFAHTLFREYFNLPVCAVAGKGFSPAILNRLFKNKDMCLVGEKYFYENTPYANVYSDIQKVMAALELKKNGKEINFKAPAFWGNMMSLVYKKVKGKIR